MTHPPEEKPRLRYQTASYNADAPPLEEVLEQFVTTLAGYTADAHDLIDMVLQMTGDPARCTWITDNGHQCRRFDSVRPFPHPVIPEGRLRLCAHHANKLASHLQAFETEGLAMARRLRLREREWNRDRPERQRRLKEAMDKAVAAMPEGVPGMVTYAMVREQWVKIGRSLDVAARYRSLLMGGAAMPSQMRHAAPLTLLFTIPGDCEAALHREFQDFREKGTEWFRNEGPVADWIASVLADADAAAEAEG